MSGRVIFLLEEPSLKAFLLEYLPRLIPGWVHGEHFLLVAHEGKSDLDKSIPVKLKAWREPDVRFVIVRDNDGADCMALKERLLRVCRDCGRTALVRLVCQELESWYLADSEALAAAYPQHARTARQLAQRFRDPDACLKPSHELKQRIPEFQKQDAARRLGRLLDSRQTRSCSFRAFTNGLQRLMAGSE